VEVATFSGYVDVAASVAVATFSGYVDVAASVAVAAVSGYVDVATFTHFVSCRYTVPSCTPCLRQT